MLPASPVLLAAMLALGASAPRNPHLAEAETLVSGLRYADAGRALSKARADPGNDRGTLLRILELTGVVEASLGHTRPAADAFSQLLYLDPGYRLGDEWGPKVKTPFYEARGWLGDHQPLSIKAGLPKVEPGRVRAVTVELGEDPLKLYREVRVHFLPEGKGKETVAKKPAAKGTLSVDAPETAEARYWVELVGAHDEVLGTAGDEAAPLVARAPAAPGAADKPPEPVAEAKPAPAPTPAPAAAPAASPAPAAAPAGGLAQTNPEPEPRFRPVAYGLMGAGVVGLAAGAFFGYQVHASQARLSSAKRDASGNIDPADLTQKDAFALDQKSKTDAVVADVCFVAGGLALASGVGLWIYGGQVSAAPAPGGGGELVLSGRWP